MGDNVIIVRKVQAAHDEHHGGSWKVAFADFAIAMMATFLVLWLIAATNPVQKKAIADYFSVPGMYHKVSSSSPIEMRGATSVSQGAPTPIRPTASGLTGYEKAGDGAAGVDDTSSLVTMLGKELTKKIGEELAAQGVKNPPVVALPKAVMIEIVRKSKGPIFPVGSYEMNTYYEDVLRSIAPFLGKLDRMIVVTGHTRRPREGVIKKGNWLLSARRAEAAREILVYSGLPENRVLQSVAMGAVLPIKGLAPEDPLNDRVEILVLSKKSHRLIEQQFNKRRVVNAPIKPADLQAAVEAAEDNEYRVR